MTDNWFVANAICENISMEMVSIETQDENEFLSKHINNQGEWIFFQGSKFSSSYVSIKNAAAISQVYWTSGIYSPVPESDFVWSNSTMHPRPLGTPFEYTNWAKGHPLENKKDNRFVLLNCSNNKSCVWETRPFERAGILCEAELDPSFKIPNVTRQAVCKQFDNYPRFPLEGSLYPLSNRDECPEMTILSTEKPTTKKPKEKSSNGNIPESFTSSTFWIAPFLLWISKYAV